MNMRFNVYETLTAKQLSRIWNSDVIRVINGKPCRMVAMGITADMRALFTMRRYIITEVQ
jgi:hypothetical protein